MLLRGLSFLVHLARAAAWRGVGEFLKAVVPGGDFLYSVATDAYAEWWKEGDEAAMRQEVEALASAGTQEALQLGQAAAKEAGLPPAEEALAGWLALVPAAIRRTCRRPADPRGATVPAALSLGKPEDLLALLPARPPRFRPGDRPLRGLDWELVEPLGAGGFGEVWKARHVSRPSLAPQVFKFCTDPAATVALRNEAALFDRLARLGDREGIVQLHETYLSADPPCLRYEYVEGGELTGLVSAWHEAAAPPPEQMLAAWRQVVGVVAGLHALSPPVVHRDLKPANVLVQSLAPLRLKVADLGIGGVAAQAELAQTQSGNMATALRGAYTPLYASPEQMRGGPPDPADDVFALGVMLFQMLTGDLGAGAPTGLDWPADLQAKYPALDSATLNALGACFSRAGKRPADAGALLELLRPAEKAGKEEKKGRKQQAEGQPAPFTYPTEASTRSAVEELPPEEGLAWEIVSPEGNPRWLEAFLLRSPQADTPTRRARPSPGCCASSWRRTSTTSNCAASTW